MSEARRQRLDAIRREGDRRDLEDWIAYLRVDPPVECVAAALDELCGG